ncbi:MAG: ATP synthase F1 subunit gamma [Elusimicrobiota bacterium]
MASLRDIRKHIKAVKNIRQITYAMKMVSSARIKKAQSQILGFKPYISYLENVVFSLKGEMMEEDFKTTGLYRFFKKESLTNSIGIVVVGGDKGLCGSFNSSIINLAVKLIRNNKGKKIYIIPVGKKSYDFFKKVKEVNLYYQIYNIFPKVNYAHASLLSSKIIEAYEKLNLDEIYMVYSEFRNMMKQEFKSISFLPIINRIGGDEGKENLEDFIFEPEKSILLKNLIPKYINMRVYSVLLENQASELAARMQAMELASKNAGELIDELTLRMNKLRQAQITTELNEIVSGASAIQ